MEGHAPFAFVNRLANPAVRGLLGSPLHRLLSGQLLLITYTGRKSGRSYTIPTGYRDRGEQIVIPIGWPERKVWWRNLREPAPVTLRLRGRELSGTARAVEREGGSVRVEVDVER